MPRPAPPPILAGRLGTAIGVATALWLLAPFALSAQLSIRSATPSAVSLPPGGPAREIVVRGTGLDGVGGVEVTRDGTLATSLSARIVRRSAGELVLSLLAGAEARPGSPLVAVLLAGRTRVEVPAVLEVAPPPTEPEPPPTDSATDSATAGSPEPVGRSVGTLRASVVPPGEAPPPPEPVTLAAGTLRATVTPPSSDPPTPVSRAVGTFRATVTPPGGTEP